MIAKPNKIPPFRKLRGYAFDPSLSLQLETADVNNIVYKLEWEQLEKADDAGRTFPRGEYIDIIDYDPATGVFYPPVDLDDLYLVLQEGHAPNINNPQFHQQMVYAVIMTTIKNFEQALGRKIQWSERYFLNRQGNIASEFVERLRVYPHALRQANAFYHPEKKALLFGYFTAAPVSVQLQMPGSTVFTCLSHDIIAHETTHAILDGLHRRYIEPTNPDTRAFHEAFADLVALFQHFTFPEVLRHQVAKTKGNLESQNLLGQLAQEFGKAVGSYGSLRDAIGYYDKVKKQWVLQEGDPADYQTKTEFHERGSILVAAVFNAFLSIYKKRIQPLLRIATGGSGILPAGDLHPDLANALADIAAKTAGQILRICVRALDYCPPVDLTFGDYLRAIITADKDMVADDELDYRVAFIEAFQRRGIFPAGVKNMSLETVCYPVNPPMNAPESIFVDFLRRFKQAINYETSRKEIYNITREYIQGGKDARQGLHSRINLKFIQGAGGKRFSQLTGLLFPDTQADCVTLGLAYSKTTKTASYQVGNVWLASRVTPQGKIVNHVIVTLLQKRGVIAAVKSGKCSIQGYFDPNSTDLPPGGFIFRGGCTLVFDLDSLCLRYAIKKDINDEERMKQQFLYTEGSQDTADGQSMYFNSEELASISGPFAFMHSFLHH